MREEGILAGGEVPEDELAEVDHSLRPRSDS